MANPPCSLVWFRQDLRLADNPALAAALERGGPVVPVYIWAPEEEGDWPPGAASRWWLHQSLQALDADLRRRGSRLIIRRGPTLATLRGLLEETGADPVYWNRRYEPAIVKRDEAIKKKLRAEGRRAESFNSALLFEPWEIETKQGGPYKVFTPFWRACVGKMQYPGCARVSDPALSVTEGLPGRTETPLAQGRRRGGVRDPRRAGLAAPDAWPSSLALKDLKLEPDHDWADGFHDLWQPGEAGAQAQLKRFLKNAVGDYPTDRDRPDRTGTSRLSPHLHFGEISPRQIWAAADQAKSGQGVGAFLRQLGWREFAYHLLFHFPHTPEKPLRPEFEKFPWSKSRVGLEAWQRGRTGYPLVDAGMRELWATGWMHNRVRMVVASFLVKDLRIPWPAGAKWFWDTLVDADLANNTLGWQWTAGCGADAAPFFRIFNPQSQADKFDPDGVYIKKWLPELGTDDYAQPIVDHRAAREAALDAYERMKGSSAK